MRTSRMSRRLGRAATLALVASVVMASAAMAADRIRLVAQRTGSLAWELDVIKAHGLDKKAGLDIETLELASTEAGKVALRGGSADIIVSDWTWVARSLDTGLDDMAQVFRMGAWVRLRHVVLPQLAPYLAAAARSGLSLVWKIVLIVELLGRPNGVGFEIGIAFQLFDVTRILAYALAFVAVMLVIETFLVQPLERHVSRWRPRKA